MKRSGDESMALAKRPKQSDENQLIVKEGPKRTSSLQAPIMLLSGHSGIVYSSRFNPLGTVLASSSFDQNIFLWKVYGECENFNVLKGHKGAVLQLDWSCDGAHLVSACTDKSGAIWDVKTGERIKKLRGHTALLNACAAASRSPSLFSTASDDGTIKIWDSRVRIPVDSLANTYQVTAVTFAQNDEQVISGGLDNVIKVWDLRKKAVAYELVGHTDTITGLRLSPDGSHLLSNSMDETLRIWDVKPYAPENRLLKHFEGAVHGNESQLIRCAWSPDGSKIIAGGSDRAVNVWDIATRRLLYKLPGHKGCVLDTDFHPKEPIIVSCGADKQIYLGEI